MLWKFLSLLVSLLSEWIVSLQNLNIQLEYVLNKIPEMRLAVLYKYMNCTVDKTIVTRNNININTGRKTPISFNLWNYVGKHCNGPSWQHSKIRRATTHTTLFLIWLTSLAMIEKRSKRRLKKEIFIIVKNIVLTKTWFVFGNFWKPYGKIMFCSSVFPTKNHY